jgi:hypothetical protein
MNGMRVTGSDATIVGLLFARSGTSDIVAALVVTSDADEK